MKKDRIAAVIVTYNRKELLQKCIESLLHQTYPLDKIFIIDNASTDGTQTFLEERCYFKNQNIIAYIRLEKNIGGSGGFCEGIKRAYEDGYDWIWIMDDDTEPAQDSLQQLVRYVYLNQTSPSVLAPAVLASNGEILLSTRGYLNLQKIWPLPFRILKAKDYHTSDYIEINFASFVGILLSKEAVWCVGFPNPNFFIYGDDVEYCIRLRKCARIYLIPKSIVYHKGVQVAFRRILWKKYRKVPIKNFWTVYYGMRNLTYIGMQYTTNYFRFYLGLLIQLIKLLIGITLFDDRKFIRMKICMLAVWDGVRKNLLRDVKTILQQGITDFRKQRP